MLIYIYIYIYIERERERDIRVQYRTVALLHTFWTSISRMP